MFVFDLEDGYNKLVFSSFVNDLDLDQNPYLRFESGSGSNIMRIRIPTLSVIYLLYTESSLYIYFSSKLLCFPYSYQVPTKSLGLFWIRFRIRNTAHNSVLCADSNMNADRDQATTASGELRFKRYCDRMGINHTAKPVLEDKDESWKVEILARVVEVRCVSGSESADPYLWPMAPDPVIF